MTVQTYHQLIVEGIRELPEHTLAEIADFVYFVRLRVLGKNAESDLYQTVLDLERDRLVAESEAHLEEEFAGYEQRYPKE